MVVQLIGAAVGAGMGFLSAREHNRALERSAQLQANFMTAGWLDERQQRAEGAGQFKAVLDIVQGGTGGPTGSASMNFGELKAAAAGDAKVDIGNIDREYRYRMDSLAEQVKSQSKSEIFEALNGAMQGFMLGSSLQSSLGSLFPANPGKIPNPGKLPGPGSRPNVFAGMTLTPMRLR